ncbi:Aldo/keto reductase [Biscogniauxia marginata]|nr:Aldo/keto reductase [Biscogniauxia marginata]
MDPIPSFKFSDGIQIPILSYGFGTANFMGNDEDIIKKTVMAIKNGFYSLDCAEAYHNEAAVGAGIKASGVPREKLFVTTKVVGSKNQDIRAALDTSLSKLGLKYLDLYLVHVPFAAGSPEGQQAIWKQMEELMGSGKVKSIGVSNCMQDDIEIILQTAKIPPAVNQIEYHPYLQHGDLIDFLRRQDIGVVVFSPLTPITTGRPGPLDETYVELAKKYGVTEGDIALRWCFDQGIPAITTSSNEQRLQGYRSKAFTFKLAPAEIKQISELGKQKHHQGMTVAYMGSTYGNYKAGTEVD